MKRTLCLALMLMAAPAPGQEAGPPAYFENPLLTSGPDPWIERDGSTYYLMTTEGNRLAIRRSASLAGLRNAEPRTVWLPPKHGPNAVSIWAPELHRVGNSWFIYYTAAEDGKNDDRHRGIFVLERRGVDPMTGPWIDRGRINTRYAGIDGTTFRYRERRYFAYSAYVGSKSVIAIARMKNPWRIVASSETIIAQPDLAWETQGGRSILEGPEFLAGPKGDLFLTYSAGACWSDDYALGLLRAPADSDPLDIGSWRKSPQPVLKKAPENGMFATGHNGFFTSPDGTENWIVFHANSGAGQKCTSRRAPYAQRFSFDARGMPDFGKPQGASTQVPEPSRPR